jgi:hypothetical protein
MSSHPRRPQSSLSPISDPIKIKIMSIKILFCMFQYLCFMLIGESRIKYSEKMVANIP